MKAFNVHELFYSNQDTRLSIGIANLNPVTQDLVANQTKMVSALEIFSDQNVNMAVFPEYCVCGYFWEPEKACRSFMETACLDQLDPWLDNLRTTFITNTLQYIVLNGLVTTPRDKRRYFNTTLVLDRSGSSLSPQRTYWKTFLPGLEKTYLASGLHDTLFLDTPHGRLGFLTCYDICFPQLVSELVNVHQVKTLVVTAAWRKQGERVYPGLDIHETDHYQRLWEKILPTLAFQHQVWVVAANAVGPHSHEGLDFCGRSGIWAPSGINLLQGSDSQEELLILHNIAIQEEIAAEQAAYSHGEDFRQIYRQVAGLNTSTRIPKGR